MRKTSRDEACLAPLPTAEAQTQTQAFKILEAALRLSAASNGAPILERCPQGHQIIISDVMGYQFDTSQPDGTIITLVAGSSRKTTRYPALRAQESETLLQLWKTLGTQSLNRNPKVRP